MLVDNIVYFLIDSIVQFWVLFRLLQNLEQIVHCFTTFNILQTRVFCPKIALKEETSHGINIWLLYKIDNFFMLLLSKYRVNNKKIFKLQTTKKNEHFKFACKNQNTLCKRSFNNLIKKKKSGSHVVFKIVHE